MQVASEVRESTKGLVFKKTVYDYYLQVRFTEEELAAINKLGITKDYDKNTLVTGLPGTPREICLSWLVDGREFVVPGIEDLVEAKHIEATTISALKTVKTMIEMASTSGKRVLEI